MVVRCSCSYPKKGDMSENKAISMSSLMGQTLTFIEYISVHKKLTLSGQVCSELLDWQKKKKNHLGFSIRSYENLKWIFDQPNTNVTLSLQVLEVTGSIIVLTLKGWLSLWRLDDTKFCFTFFFSHWIALAFFFLIF